MRKVVVTVLVLAVLCVVPLKAGATLINRPGALFYDTETQLTWYDPTVYSGMSWLEANAILPDGVQIATEAEVWDMLLKYAAQIASGNPTGIYDNPNLPWYMTIAGSPPKYDPISGEIVNYPHAFENLYWNIYPTHLVIEPNLASYDGTIGNGVWTVTEGAWSPVPAPPALLLLGSGLLGLAKFRKRFAAKR